MTRRQYITQIGMGVDLHGGNDTKAAQRAVNNAIQNNNMLFLKHVGIKSSDQILVEVLIASPHPDTLEVELIAGELPAGRVSVQTQVGGLLQDIDGGNDPVLAAIATVTVSTEM